MLVFLFLLSAEVVENGLTPAHPMKLKLVQEFVLGEDEDDDYQQFTMGAQMVADDSGMLYILDPGNDRVVVYNDKGKFVRKFGQEGMGPGEFQQPKEICFNHKNQLAIFDLGSKKMNLFDTEGKFLGEKAMPQPIVSLSHPVFMDNGNLLLSVVRLDPDGTQNFDLILYDENFEALKTITSIPQPKKDWSKMGEPQFWVTFLKDIFEGIENGIPIGAAYDGNTFAAIRSNVYKATIFDGNGQEKGGFEKKLKPLPFTDEAKEAAYGKVWQSLCNNPFLSNNMPRPIFLKALEKAEVGPAARPIWEMTNMGDLVVFLVNYDSTSRAGVLEFFDKTGNLKAQLDYKGTDEYLHGAGNRIYSLGSNEDDILTVTRYRVEGLGAHNGKPVSH